MSALIGALRISLSADTAQFSEGMRRAQTQATTAAIGIQKALGGLKASIAGLVAGLSVGMFVNAIRGALEYAGSLAEVAQQVGVTAKDLQVLRFAGGQVGITTEEMDKALQKFTKSLGDARAGSAEAIKTFKAIGFTDQDIAKLDIHDALMKTADGIAAAGDRAARATPEVRLLGRAGQQLDPLLSQGSKGISELAQAAEKLGIVLSDEQIRHADDTADKITALKTVLQANIAGEVADNADAILTLANALATLVRSIGQAVQGWRIMVHEFKAAGDFAALNFTGATRELNAAEAIRQGGIAYGVGSVTMKLPPAKPKAIASSGGGDFGKFLAGSGSKNAKEDHSAETALRDANQFDQDLRRAQMDTLRAQQDLAKDYIERTTIGIQILDAEKSAYEAELAYEVALNALTKGKQGMTAPQAAQLQAEYNIKDSLERQKLLQDEQEQRQRDVQELTQHDYDRRRDVLESQAAIADTSAERRKIELELLRLAYEQKRQALQNIINTSKDAKEQEDARRDLANLNATYGSERQGVIRGTRGPLEAWAASVPQTAAQINEALQTIEANGLEGLSDAITNVITGTESLKEAFGDLAKSIIADIIRMSIKMLIFRALSSVFGKAFGGDTSTVDPWSETMGGIYSGIPGFARGGSMRLGGVGGIDTNILSANGVAVARYTAGERIDIANDNVNAGPSRVVIELRDPLLDARISEGSRVEIARTYGAVQAGVGRSEFEKRRRAP